MVNAAPLDLRLSVVIPACNEKKSLADNVQQAIKNKEVCQLIIIVLSFAGQETLKTCQELAAFDKRIEYHIQKKNPGLGCALCEAFELVQGTHVQIFYADCESDPASIPDFIKKARETDADVVVGSRWMAGGTIDKYPSLQYFLNWAYQRSFRALFRTPLHDLTFGYNLIRTSVLKNIIWEGKKHEITTEMVLKAFKLNYHIEEIPVHWKPRDEGASAINKIWYLNYPLMALSIWLRPKKSFCLVMPD